MNRRNVGIMAVGVLLIAGAAACGGGSEHAVMAVSVPAQKAIAERFGGGVEVLALVSGDVDPESFEISIRTAAQASGAKAYFPTGALPFERNFVEALHGSVPVVATGTDIEPIEGTHGEHGGVDPHVWTSAGFRRAFADGYFRELCRLYPDSVDNFSRRASEIQNMFAMQDDSIRRVLGGREYAFGIMHPSLSYFARDWGLRQIAFNPENKEPGAMAVRQLVDSMRAAGVKVIFYEDPGSEGQARLLADEVGARAVAIDLMSGDIGAELVRIANEIARP